MTARRLGRWEKPQYEVCRRPAQDGENGRRTAVAEIPTGCFAPKPGFFFSFPYLSVPSRPGRPPLCLGDARQPQTGRRETPAAGAGGTGTGAARAITRGAAAPRRFKISYGVGRGDEKDGNCRPVRGRALWRGRIARCLCPAFAVLSRQPEGQDTALHWPWGAKGEGRVLRSWQHCHASRTEGGPPRERKGQAWP